MSAHLYQVGDVVSLDAAHGAVFSSLNPFTIEARMPHVGTSLQYRVKSQSEAFRRVVPEHQIDSLGGQPITQPAIVLGAARPDHAVGETF